MKQTTKAPVEQTVGMKLADKLPRSIGDKMMQNVSAKKAMELGSRPDMAEISGIIMRKSVIKDIEGNEVSGPSQMQPDVPYIIETQQSHRNVGWIMSKGNGAGVGRIYQNEDYDEIKNDPDRPELLRDVDFEDFDPVEFGLAPDMEGAHDFSDEPTPEEIVHEQQQEAARYYGDNINRFMQEDSSAENDVSTQFQ